MYLYEKTNFQIFLNLQIVLSINSCIHLLFLDNVGILVLKFEALHLRYKKYTYIFKHIIILFYIKHAYQ